MKWLFCKIWNRWKKKSRTLSIEETNVLKQTMKRTAKKEPTLADRMEIDNKCNCEKKNQMKTFSDKGITSYNICINCGGRIRYRDFRV